jgi:multicomponent Na+:H+ antiporter subunit B
MNDRLLETIVKLLMPIIMVYGIFIILHGHVTPGGGFSGGAILGAGLILYGITFGEKASLKLFPHKLSKILESGGVLTYLVIGFIGLLVSGAFLTNLGSVFNPGTPGSILSAGMIPLLMIAIGLKVGSTMMTLFTHLLEDESI